MVYSILKVLKHFLTVCRQGPHLQIYEWRSARRNAFTVIERLHARCGTRWSPGLLSKSQVWRWGPQSISHCLLSGHIAGKQLNSDLIPNQCLFYSVPQQHRNPFLGKSYVPKNTKYTRCWELNGAWVMGTDFMGNGEEKSLLGTAWDSF